MGAGTFNRPTPGYGQPPQGYAQPPQAYGAAPARRNSGLAIAGLVMGIIAMLTFWVWGAVLFAPLAIIFGILGRNEARRDPAKAGEGLGTAGLALGIVSVVLTVPWAIFVATL